MQAFFQEIANSIKDFKFYKEAKDFKLSRAMKYIFSLILLITIAVTLRYSYDFKKGLNLAVNWAEQNLPLIVIENGIAKTDVIQPFRVSEEDFTFIIDTTGGVTSLDEYERGILLMNDKVVYKESDIKTETYSLSNVQSLRIDETFIKALRKNALWILFPIMLVAAYIGFCIAKFFQILFFSMLSLATSSITGTKLSYKQIFNIGIYALTPSAVLGALLAILGIQLPFFGIIYCGLYIIYLIMAVRSCKEKPIPAEGA